MGALADRYGVFKALMQPLIAKERLRKRNEQICELFRKLRKLAFAQFVCMSLRPMPIVRW